MLCKVFVNYNVIGTYILLTEMSDIQYTYKLFLVGIYNDLGDWFERYALGDPWM